MNWKRVIEQIAIDEYVTQDNITVARLSNWRYVVLKDGVVYDFGGSAHPPRGLLMARVLECVTGEPQVEPCADCDQPRTDLSYCRKHYNERHSEFNRRMRHG